MFFLFAVFFIIQTALFSQSCLIRGQVADSSTKEILMGANIMLSDVSYKQKFGTTTDNTGKFRIAVFKSVYEIQISYVGYKTYKEVIDATNELIDFGTIYLPPQKIETAEIEVTGKIPPFVLKKDTIEYNSDAYKLDKDAAAYDLLKKMPGLDLTDGKVKAQGKDVSKVLVDGKPFISKDPKIVLKEMPAESVEKVQVYKDKEDESEKKISEEVDPTINLVTRKKYKNSIFGKSSGGVGTNKLYSAASSLNFLNEYVRKSVEGTITNIDLISSRFSGEPGFFLSGTGGKSYLKNLSGNYQNFISDQLNFESYLNLSNSKYSSNTSTHRDYLGEENQTYNQLFSSMKKDNLQNGSIVLLFTLDSLTSIRISPTVNFSDQNSNSTQSASTSSGDKLLSSSLTNTFEDSRDKRLSGKISFSKRFNKPGRELRSTISVSYSSDKSEGSTFSEIYFPSNSDSFDTTYRKSLKNQTNNGLVTFIKYLEPLNSESKVEFQHELVLTNSNQDNRSYDILTNSFLNSFSSNLKSRLIHTRLAGGYNLNNEVYRLSINGGLQLNKINYEQQVPYKSSVNKLFASPVLTAVYKNYLSPDDNLETRYSLNYITPQANQLQYEVDYTNPINLTTGNPSLKPASNHLLSLSYSAIDLSNSHSTFLNVGYYFTDNYSGMRRFTAESDTTVFNDILLKKGVSITYPENFGQSHKLYASAEYGFPLEMVSSNLKLNLSYVLSRTPLFLQKKLTNNINQSYWSGFNLISNINSVDFEIYGTAKYTVWKSENLRDEFNYTSGFTCIFNFLENLFLRAAGHHEYNNTFTINKHQTFLNVVFGIKFLRDKSLQVRLAVNDIFNNTTNMRRDQNNLYTENYSSDNYGRSFMLLINYNLKHFPE